MLLSAVSVLVVAQSSSEIPEGLMNNPVFTVICQESLKSEDVITDTDSLTVCLEVQRHAADACANLSHCQQQIVDSS